MKFTSFNRQSAISFGSEAEIMLKQLAQKYGVTLAPRKVK